MVGQHGYRQWLVIIGLSCLEASSRGLLLAIVPIQLLAQFGTLQGVTYFYAAVAIFALGNSILVPGIIERYGIRNVVTLSGIFTATSAVLIAFGTLAGVSAGLIVRAVALACLDIPLLALIMATVPRNTLGTFEPVRVFFQGICLAAAPWIGFQLYERVAGWLPFALAVVGGLLFIAISRKLPQLKVEPGRTRGQGGRAFKRFFQQPRLVSAWLLAIIRSSFWQVYYIYSAIFAVSRGWGAPAAAALLSLGLGTLLFVPIWGRMGRSLGARSVLVTAYLCGGLSLICAAASAMWAPYTGPFFLLGAAFFASMVDGVGNVLFLRATRPLERPRMAGIYMTYRDIAQFAPIVIFALVLSLFQFSTALLVLAAAFITAAWLSLLIHPRIR
ncbi:MAG: MFS transporter [Variibacter sp.]